MPLAFIDFPLHRYSHFYIHHSRYKWETPLFVRLELNPCGLPYLNSSFCVNTSPLREQYISVSSPLIYSFIFIIDKLERGEHIRISLFNQYWSRRAVPRVPISRWGLVSLPFRFLTKLYRLGPSNREVWKKYTWNLSLRSTTKLPSNLLDYMGDKSELRGATSNFLPQ